MHTPPLLFSLVAALSLALVLGYAARRLRLPPLLGYLLAGVVVGPHTPGILVDQAITAQMAEIGVALLLFGVGLHFRLPDLLAVWRLAVPGALGQVAIGCGLGALAGWWGLGLAPGGALVFGLDLAIASTAVATRLLTERGRMDGEAGRIALGWLVLQDLVVVFALVLLPSLGGIDGPTGGPTGDPLLGGLLRALLALAGFVMVMALFGRRALPWLLARAAGSGSRELFTLAVVVAALGVSWAAAELFGVSLALGAFFAGVVLGETEMSHQAAARALPLEQVFTVLFFVSVGMQLRPEAVLEAPGVTVAVVLVTLLGSGGAALALLLALRVEWRTALTVAVALAQIGEFSFVLTGLATERHLLPDAARGPVLVAAFVLILANPALAAAADRLAARFARPNRAEQGPLPRPALRQHAIIVGHGRVGSVVAAALARHGLPYVVVEANHRLAKQLRARGVPTVWGDAMDPEVLAATRPDRARLLVIALPIAFQARQVLDLARAANPRIDVAVRAHADEEMAFLAADDAVGLVVMGEREVALSTCDYALRRFGLEAAAAQATVDSLRAAMPGAAALDPAPAQSP